MAQAEFLRKRADEFLENARENVQRKRFNLAAFNLEQACQLYLKYRLFLKLADFPRTHSIRELLADLGRARGQETEVKKLMSEKNSEIADLEEAHLTSRYLPADFDEKRVGGLEKFTNDLVNFLARL